MYTFAKPKPLALLVSTSTIQKQHFVPGFGWENTRDWTDMQRSMASFLKRYYGGHAKSLHKAFAAVPSLWSFSEKVRWMDEPCKGPPHVTEKDTPSLKLTVRPWKLVLGRRSFPFGARPIFRGYVCFGQGKEKQLFAHDLRPWIDKRLNRFSWWFWGTTKLQNDKNHTRTVETVHHHNKHTDQERIFFSVSFCKNVFFLPNLKHSQTMIFLWIRDSCIIALNFKSWNYFLSGSIKTSISLKYI